MAWINEIVCENSMKGWCDALGKNPKNYVFTFILTIFMTYIFPIFLTGIIAIFFSNVYFNGTYLDLLSPVIPGISLLYDSNSIIGVVVLGVIALIIDLCYLLYMIRQLGIFSLIPIVIEIPKILIIVFFKEWWIAGIVLSLIPWMGMSVGSHFISYRIEKGLIVKHIIGN